MKFAITHEETRFQLNGALLKMQPAKMEMVATDGHRMALINFPQGSNGKKKGTDLTILIPRKALEEILRLEAGEDGNVRFGVSENQLFFEAGERRLLARMIDVNFPNYMEVISRDNDRHVLVDRERLLSTIRRISLVANERTRAVRFDFAPGKLTVSSTNPELGDARETVPIDYAGNPFFVGLNAAYVTDFLSAVDTPQRLARSEGREQPVHRPPVVERRGSAVRVPVRRDADAAGVMHCGSAAAALTRSQLASPQISARRDPPQPHHAELPQPRSADRVPSSVNIVVGRNGQGKTNLLEAIYFLATTKSFRTARIGSLFRFGSPSVFVAGAAAALRRREDALGRPGDAARRGGACC